MIDMMKLIGSADPAAYYPYKLARYVRESINHLTASSNKLGARAAKAGADDVTRVTLAPRPVVHPWLLGQQVFVVCVATSCYVSIILELLQIP